MHSVYMPRNYSYTHMRTQWWKTLYSGKLLIWISVIRNPIIMIFCCALNGKYSDLYTNLLIWTFRLYDHLLVRACSDKWLQAYFTPKLKIVVTLLSWYEPRVFIDCLCSIVTIVTLLPWLMAWYGCIVLTSYTRYDKILWLCLEWYTPSLNGLYSCTEYLRAIYGKYFKFLGMVVWLCLVVIAHINCFKDSCVKRHQR